jgi:hypothetical protein
MTSSLEQTAKKTPAPSIVALLSNGCKQAFPLLTVDLQRAHHNIITFLQTTLIVTESAHKLYRHNEVAYSLQPSCQCTVNSRLSTHESSGLQLIHAHF